MTSPDDPCAIALRMVAAAGEPLPDTWCGREHEGSLVIEFSGAPTLQLRTDADDYRTWSLWFAGTRIGLFRTPSEALAVARSRGFWRRAPMMTAQPDDAWETYWIRKMAQPNGLLPLGGAPSDGTWVLVGHPDSEVPAIGRPIGPGSEAWENYWKEYELFIPSGGWLPIPTAWHISG